MSDDTEAQNSSSLSLIKTLDDNEVTYKEEEEEKKKKSRSSKSVPDSFGDSKIYSLGNEREDEDGIEDEDDEIKLIEWGEIEDSITRVLKGTQILYLIANVVSIILSVCLIAIGFSFYMILIDGIFRLVSCIVGLAASVLYLLRISDYDKRQMNNAHRLLLLSNIMITLEFISLLAIVIYVKVPSTKIDIQASLWFITLFVDISNIPLLFLGIFFFILLRRRL
jgi:hypothetical protein